MLPGYVKPYVKLQKSKIKPWFKIGEAESYTMWRLQHSKKV